MNPVFTGAADTLPVSSGLWMGVVTAVFILSFLGWAIWAWAPGNREAMESASRIPLDDDDSPSPSLSHEGGGA